VSGPLANLDSIPWDKIHHAYGAATDVPQLLRALLSRVGAKREKALRELYGNLWHQHTIYEATSYAVPFLVALLDAPETPHKAEIAIYLANLFLAQTGESEHMEATRRTVESGAATYLRLLTSKNDGDQIAAAYLLGLIRQWDVIRKDDDLSVIEQVAKAAAK